MPAPHATPLLFGLLALLAPAAAQETEQGTLQALAEEESWPETIARDARTGFSARGAQRALAQLDRSTGTPEERAVALVALGAAGMLAERQRLESWAAEGHLLERQGAILALGELGRVASDRLGGSAEPILAGLLDDPSSDIAECALLALLRTGSADWRTRAEDIALEPAHRLSGPARRFTAFVSEPALSAPQRTLRLLLDLRWSAARRFGTVDGQAWSVTLLDMLGEDEGFLEEVVLGAAAELKFPGVKDHLLELLLEERTPAVLRACVQHMPVRLDELIDSELLWPQLSEEEWAVLVDAAVEQNVGATMARAMARATSVPLVAPTAAGEIFAQDERHLEAILSALGDADPERRVRGARALRRAKAAKQLRALEKLEKDEVPRVRAAAWVARWALGDTVGRNVALETLLGPADHPERAVLFEEILLAYRELPILQGVEERLDALPDVERGAAQAALYLRDQTFSVDEVRRTFDLLDLESYGGRLALRALGQAGDVGFLARRFPLEGHPRANVEIALILARTGHDSVRPLLYEAIWSGPMNRSVLAAAVVKGHYSVQLLVDWADKPPASATSEDIRRLGFAVGEWGGLEALETLDRTLGGRTDHPALQGAMLGALLARTH